MTSLFRRNFVRSCGLLISALVAFQCALVRVGAATDTTDLPAPAKRLDDLIAANWTFQMAHSPMLALLANQRQGTDHWQDMSKQGLLAWQEHDEKVLQAMHSIPRSSLTREQQSIYDQFESEAQAQVGEFQHRLYLVSFMAAAIRFWPSVPQALRFAEQQKFDSVQDYENWLRRLDSLPTFLDQQEQIMREGIQAHWTPTKSAAQDIAALVESQHTAAVESTLFYKPYRQFPSTVSTTEQSRLSDLAKQTIAIHVQPALGRLEAFLKNEYIPAAQDSPGLSHWPEGADLYTFLARESTGTQLDVQEMRELGSHEVDRIRREMEGVLPKLGHGKTLAEVFDWIQTDPALHCKTGEELLTTYRATAKRIDPTVVRSFAVLPRMPYGVDGIKAGRGLGGVYHPPSSASGPGVVVVDIAKPEIRPKNEIMAIMLHEGVPGHHLQYAFDLERWSLDSSDDRNAEDILRQSRSFSTRDMGFVEGWGLYAESLGDELGLYADPLDKFGELNLGLSRAARVMIDSGIHSLGWTQEKAIQYFVEVTGKPVSVATDEVGVAIANPGAQLAYTIGQLQFQRMRSQASHELGSKFDVREFHNFVLQAGPLPFDILEQHLNEWIHVKEASSGPNHVH